MIRPLGLLGVVAATAILAGAPPALAQSTLESAPHVIVVSGIGGTPEYVDLFFEQASALVEAAQNRWGLPDDRLTWLSEDVSRAPGQIAARSTREEFEKQIASLAGRTGPNDRVLIVLIGHGTATPDGAKLNLPGPDLTGAELGAWLDALPTRAVAVVNTASASGGFTPALAADGRIVVTATRSAREAERTHFGEFFVEAFADDGADTDKDRRVSLLEAFTYARDEVERYYERENQLQTEHPVLEDGADGTLAAAFHLAPARVAGADGAATGATTGASNATDDPVLAGLLAEKQRIEQAITALRARRDSMDEADYDAAFEELVLELATANRAIRAAGEGS